MRRDRLAARAAAARRTAGRSRMAGARRQVGGAARTFLPRPDDYQFADSHAGNLAPGDRDGFERRSRPAPDGYASISYFARSGGIRPAARASRSQGADHSKWLIDLYSENYHERRVQDRRCRYSLDGAGLYFRTLYRGEIQIRST